MTLITTGMVLALLIPIALLCRQCNAWERLAAFGSIGTKVAMLALVVAVMRGDRMLALVGALVLCGCACACRYIPRWSGAARVAPS